MLPRKDQMTEVAFLNDGPLLEAFYIHPVSSQNSIICFRLALFRFPAIFFRQLFLVVSLLPGCVQSISFFFSWCGHLLRLLFLQPFPSFPYLLYILSNWISTFSSMFTFWKPSYSCVSRGPCLCPCLLTLLESGAPLSSFLEEVLYKSLNEWMNIESLKMRLISEKSDDFGHLILSRKHRTEEEPTKRKLRITQS